MIFSLHVTAESDVERILKIGENLPKLWAIKYRIVFFMKHGVYFFRMSLYSADSKCQISYRYSKNGSKWTSLCAL